MLRDITLENINLTLRDEALRLGPVENFSAKNVVLNGKPYVLPSADKPKS